MSNVLLTAAWKLKLPPSEKIVLIALCDWANDDGGSCHPSIKAVSVRSCLSERQSQRIMHALVEGGWITVVGNFFGGKPGETRQYRINVNAVLTGDAGVTGVKKTRVTNGAKTGDICDMVRVTSATKTGDTHDTLSIIEPSLRATITKSNHQTRVREKVIPEGFDQFWKTYPRKDSKQDAIKAWWKISEIDRMAVASILPRWVRSWKWIHEPQFIPHGATWLNKRRWEDPPPPLDADRAAPSKTRQLIDDLMDNSHGYDRNLTALAGPAADPWDDNPDGTVIATVTRY